MRILFVCPHPDDLELYVGNFLHQCIVAGHIVKIVAMTRGEMSGDLTPVIKSSYKAAEIRTKELCNSCHILGAPIPDFLGFIDGAVNITFQTIQLMKKYMETFSPDVVVASEPVYSFRTHHDHINTGKLVFYAAKRMLKSPAVYYYHSFFNHIYLPKLPKYRDLVQSAIHAHRSQARYFIGPFTLLTIHISDFLHGLKTTPIRKAEALRRQYVPNRDPMSARQKLSIRIHGWKSVVLRLLLQLSRLGTSSSPFTSEYYDGTLPPTFSIN